MLQLRMVLPENFESDGGLTEEGEQWMMMYRALLEKEGLYNFQVVRLKS